MKIQDAAKNDDNPITKKTFDDAVTSGFHYCNNLAHNNNTETRFVSSGVNVKKWYDDQDYFTQLRVLDDSAIDVCPLVDKYDEKYS